MALAVSLRMRAKSPFLIHSAGAIHEPPQATTLLNPRYALTFAALIPPVGRNRTLPYGAAMALRYGSPPIGSAGKNFRVSSPRESAASMSVGVQMPGKTGSSRARHQSTTGGLQPGATMKRAPA